MLFVTTYTHNKYAYPTVRFNRICFIHILDRINKGEYGAMKISYL